MSRELHILSACTRYLPLRAGAENMMHQVHRVLVEMGHRVTVLVVHDEKEGWAPNEVIDGVEIERVGTDYGYEMMAAAMERHKPDMVFAQFALLPYAIERCVEVDVPVVAFCHTGHGFGTALIAGLTEMVDLFVFNSPMLRNEADNTNVRNVVVVPPLERDRVIAPVRDPQCITAINLCAIKGGRMFWEMAKRFPERRFLGVKGGYEDQIVEDLPNVTVLDHGADMRLVYGRTKVLLMASRYETFGMAAVEAQANGIPVIASDLPGLRYALDGGAIFVKPDDMDGWEKALHTLDRKADYERLAGRAKDNVTRHDFTRDMKVLGLVLADLVRKKPRVQRPGIQNLPNEMRALYAYVIDEVRKRTGREAPEAEVIKLVGGPDKPQDIIETLVALVEVERAAIGG